MQSQSCYTNSSFILLPVQFLLFFKSSRPAKGNYNLSTLAWTLHPLILSKDQCGNRGVELSSCCSEPGNRLPEQEGSSLSSEPCCVHANITRRLKDRTESTECCGDHQPYGLSIITRWICSSLPMRRDFPPESNKAFISVTRLTLKALFLGSVMSRYTFCSHKN